MLKNRLYKISTVALFIALFASCDDNAIINNDTDNLNDIITPYVSLNNTRVSIGPEGDGDFESGDSIYITGTSRSSWYIYNNPNWVSDEPLRWSEETPVNGKYSFTALFKDGYDVTDENAQTPVTLFAYQKDVSKNANLILDFIHVDAKMEVILEITQSSANQDEDIVWDNTAEIYINDILTGIRPYVNSNDTIKAYATGSRRDVLMTTVTNDGTYNFDGAIANVAPGQQITSLSISTNNRTKYFTIRLVGDEIFIPEMGKINTLKLKIKQHD